ncbi:MAG TPA: hypothetical protein VH373_22420 [Jatrophihabitantaceae bacterium]|jgi:predicted lipoprotein with Yx(FWY)xxD motif
MNRTMQAMLGLGSAGLLALTACSSSGGSKADTAPASGGSGGMTVNVSNVSGTGDVLTDSNGHTLYSSDEEASGKILCDTKACLTFWQPLLVADGSPTGPSSITAKLTTVTRPDGKMQVALNGAPLYSFTEDHSSGDTKGNNFTDNFGSQSFTWHVATPAGIASQAPGQSSAPSTPSYSYPNGGGGGY